MTTRALIGNDIVDLGEPGVARKEEDRRFMDRVFTPEERARILAAAAPTIALWKTWSAKETAYKIAGKLREGLVFRHQAFEVHLDAPPTGSDPGGVRDAASAAAGATLCTVRFEDLVIRARWETARDYIHCIGHLVGHPQAGEAAPADRSDATPARGNAFADLAHDWQEFLGSLRDRWRVMATVAHNRQALHGELTRAEQASVHSNASERARLLARRLMERWELQGAEIVRHWRTRGWSPPLVALEGQPLAGFDVTLSHDGRFVAAAVAGPK